MEASINCTVFLSELTGTVLQNMNSKDTLVLGLGWIFFFWEKNTPFNLFFFQSELVLKVRVQNLRDNDFIEIELDRQELTYQDLLRVSCCELGVNPEQVEKIRKLPNTLVRKVRIEIRD